MKILGELIIARLCGCLGAPEVKGLFWSKDSCRVILQFAVGPSATTGV